MSNIVLSFCIPTYNRPERIENIINQIIPFQSEEIEIVISDDNPSFEKTQEVVKKFTDPRIKYFRNMINLGAELNMIKTIERSNGIFVFFLTDEDDIEMKTVPWILKIIKSNKNLAQLCGTIGDKRQGQKEIYLEFGDGLLKQGHESLKRLLFYYTHGSGAVFKKATLNLNRALKSTGRLCLLENFTGQACIAGDTLCTLRKFAYIGKDQYDSCQPLIKGRIYSHPLYRLDSLKDRVAIINDITDELKNSRELREFLLSKEKVRIYRFLNEALLISFKSFLEGINITRPIRKNFKFSRFWTELLIYLLHSFCHRKLNRFHRGTLNYFISQATKFLDLVKSSFLKMY